MGCIAVLGLRLTNNGTNYRMMDAARLTANNTIAPTPHRHRRTTSIGHVSLTDVPSNTNNTITSSSRVDVDDDDNKEEVSLVTAEVVSTSLPFNRSMEEKKASLSTSSMLSLPQTLVHHDGHTNTHTHGSGINATPLTQLQQMMLSTSSYTTFKSLPTAPTSQLSSLMMSSPHRRLSAAGLSSLNMQHRYISYGIAAAAAASAAGASTVTNGTLIAAARSIPHPDKIHKGGEDAHFLSPMSVGVFDGVGGWAEHGVDPAEYSRALGNASKTWANNVCHHLTYQSNVVTCVVHVIMSYDIVMYT
jgi:hypothetical protein